MKARAALRAATAGEHERVDALFAAYPIGGMEGYRRFLLAQASAFLPVEAALEEGGIERLVPDWPARRRSAALLSDLAALGAAPPAPVPAPPLGTDAAMLGALYVLEGSRLGGALLKRAIPAEAPRAFLDAPQPKGAWRTFLEYLEKLLYESAQEDAISAARLVFDRFEAAGRHHMEDQAA